MNARAENGAAEAVEILAAEDPNRKKRGSCNLVTVILSNKKLFWIWKSSHTRPIYKLVDRFSTSR
jgi:hypothetical protein